MNERHQRSRDLRVGILGGGITGLTAAFYLLKAGAQVTVIEGRQQPGGLSTSFDFGPFRWDRFYHCILTSDKSLLTLLEDLGLSEEIHWTETKVGFFAEDRLYSMSSTRDFLKFPPLSLWQKFRLGLGILYASRIRNARRLESMPVAEWLIRVFGEDNYRKMWGPLLKAKLGACREEASAAFIWATIFRLFSTRDRKAGNKERLGYVQGGYQRVLSVLTERIVEMGGKILTGIPVEKVCALPDGDVECAIAAQKIRFDRVISTIPSGPFSSIVAGLPEEYGENLRRVKYLGVVCLALVLRRRLSPYYVTNLTDESLPFTGIIEMTNLISLGETRGYHLVYLPKYTAPNDPLFASSDEQIWNLFRAGLLKVFPDLKDCEIENRFVFRERWVQPLPVLHYSYLAPSMETGVKGVLLANTTQIINSTLNNNEMVRIGRQAADRALVREKRAEQDFPLSAKALQPVTEAAQISPISVAGS